MLWLYNMSLKMNCINKTVYEFKLMLWHLWLPLWSFKSRKCQMEILQWREWSAKVQYTWVCQGHVLILTRMTSRKESVWNINTQEMTQRRGKHLHSSTSLPQKVKKKYQTFLKMQLNRGPDLIELPVDTHGFIANLSNSFHHSLLALTNWKWTFKPQALSTG